MQFKNTQPMSKKKIEDYLHLYLGCEIENNNGVYRGTLIGFRQPCEAIVAIDYFNKQHRKPENKEHGEHFFLAKAMRPILRPLSDMTDEEKTEIAKMWTWFQDRTVLNEEHFEYIHDSNKKMVLEAFTTANEDDGARMSPSAYFQAFPYLLKQGFDLFNLIESGLAIDKTKLNHP